MPTPDGQNQPLPQVDMAMPMAGEATGDQLATNFYDGISLEGGWPAEASAFGPSQETMDQFPLSPFADETDQQPGGSSPEPPPAPGPIPSGPPVELGRETNPGRTADPTDKPPIPVEFTTTKDEANLVFKVDGTIEAGTLDANKDNQVDSTFMVYAPKGTDAEQAWQSFLALQTALKTNNNIDIQISKDDFIKKLNESAALSEPAPTPGGSPGEQPTPGGSPGGGKQSCGPGGCGKGGSGGGSSGGGSPGGGGGDTGGGGSPGGGAQPEGGGTPGGSPGGDATNPPAGGTTEPSSPGAGRAGVGGDGSAPVGGDRGLVRGQPGDSTAARLPYGIRDSAQQAVLKGIHPMNYANFASTFFRPSLRKAFAAVDINGDGVISDDEKDYAEKEGTWDKLTEEEAALDEQVKQMSEQDPDSKKALTELAGQFKDHTGQADFHQALHQGRNNLMDQQQSGSVTQATVDKVFGADRVGRDAQNNPIANSTKTAIARQLINDLPDSESAKGIKALSSEPAKGSPEETNYKKHLEEILKMLAKPPATI